DPRTHLLSRDDKARFTGERQLHEWLREQAFEHMAEPTSAGLALRGHVADGDQCSIGQDQLDTLVPRPVDVLVDEASLLGQDREELRRLQVNEREVDREAARQLRNDTEGLEVDGLEQLPLWLRTALYDCLVAAQPTLEQGSQRRRAVERTRSDH